MSVQRGRLLIWERTGRWARLWRELIPNGAPRIHELRSASDVESELSTASASLLAIEFDAANWEARSDAALKWSRHYGHVRIIVLAEPDLSSLELWFREVGAIDVVYCRQDLIRASRLAMRHLDRFPSADRTICQQWLDRLNWHSATTSRSAP